jgi:hypothetical protein
MEDSVSYTGQYHLNGEEFDAWGGGTVVQVRCPRDADGG